MAMDSDRWGCNAPECKLHLRLEAADQADGSSKIRARKKSCSMFWQTRQRVARDALLRRREWVGARSNLRNFESP